MLQKIGNIIAGLNIFAMLMSVNYFLIILKFPISAWLAFNACFPSTFIFLIGFFLKNRIIMTASLPFLAFFGVGGMFVFSWKGSSLPAQFGHIMMALAIIYTIFNIISAKEWNQFFIGIAIGLLVFAFILPIQQKYVKMHPEYLKKLGDPKFEESNLKI